jgi:AcrR family transcriptional regulator
VARPKTDTRQRLLLAAVDAAATHGLSTLSLRQLAEHLGTSHRMLLFHFGSRDGLLLEIVRHMEQQQRELLLDQPGHGDPAAVAGQMNALWARLRLPAMWPYERLFFELYVQALQGVEPAVRLLDDVIDPWVDAMSGLLVSVGVPEAVARTDARLALAVCRGLLLDLVATHDLDAVDAAVARYAELFALGHPALGGPVAS